MMTLSSRAAATAFATLLLMSSAFAQTSATPAPGAAPAATSAPKEKKANNPQSPASLECSKEADAKGIHGKKGHRKQFMAECKRAAKEAAAKK